MDVPHTFDVSEFVTKTSFNVIDQSEDMREGKEWSEDKPVTANKILNHLLIHRLVVELP